MAATNAGASPATTAAKPSLTLVREFDAPPEAVWDAWTRPEALKRWFGPDAGEVTVTLSLKSVGKRTELTVLHEEFFDMAARDEHQRGWTGTMEKLARYFAQVSK